MCSRFHCLLLSTFQIIYSPRCILSPDFQAYPMIEFISYHPLPLYSPKAGIDYAILSSLKELFLFLNNIHLPWFPTLLTSSCNTNIVPRVNTLLWYPTEHAPDVAIETSMHPISVHGRPDLVTGISQYNTYEVEKTQYMVLLPTKHMDK